LKPFRVFIHHNCLPVRCLSAPACAACTADRQARKQAFFVQMLVPGGEKQGSRSKEKP